jgi:ketosteroid isomerase-like protein
MKLAASLVTLLGLITIGVAGETEDRAELKKIEERMAQLLAQNDVDALLPYLSSDWKLVVADGSVLTRAELTEVIKSGKLKFSSDRVEEVDIRLYADTAVVLGITKSQGTWEGTEFTGRDRFTDVFIRKDGKWICVSSHSSELSNDQ